MIVVEVTHEMCGEGGTVTAKSIVENLRKTAEHPERIGYSVHSDGKYGGEVKDKGEFLLSAKKFGIDILVIDYDGIREIR